MELPLRPAADKGGNDPKVPRARAWLAFALVIGLMLSDFMSRQVISAVFPFLKDEWSLSDAQLGSLASVVALVVGVMTFPVSLLADRFGRVRGVVAMAIVWGLATIGCGLAHDFTTMFIARALVGLGEAGYGSAGGAILTSLFPACLHATVMGSFLAAALFGSVLGVVAGGLIAEGLGWRMAFVTVGAGGLLLAVVFPFAIREAPGPVGAGAPLPPLRTIVRDLFRLRAANFTYLASGLNMFAQVSVLTWAPSYLNRYYGLDPAGAALGAGLLLMVAGVGMALGGVLVDRLSTDRPRRRLFIPAIYSAASSIVLLSAFSLPPGPLQFALIVCGLLVGAGYAGPAGAVVADVHDRAIRATALATLALANNLIGLAPGPWVTGLLADARGLDAAFRVVPLTGLLAALFFVAASRHYESDRRRHARDFGDGVAGGRHR